MTTIVALLAYAAGILLVAPALLTRGTWQIHYPRTALLAWHVALGSAVVAAVGSIAAAVLIVLDAGRVASDFELVSIGVFAWMSLAAIGGFTALLASGVSPVAQSAQVEQRAASHLVFTSAYDTLRDGRVAVRLVDAEVPFAAAIRLPEPTIIITRGLASRLTAAQLAAVKEHERTHLTQRHDLVAAGTAVMGMAMSRSRRHRQLQEATHLLIELIADDAAARRCGPAHLANALACTAELTGDPALELRAQRLAARRWRPRRRAVRHYRRAVA